MAVDVGHQERAAVARLLRNILGREHTGDAALVLDDDLLVPHHAELDRPRGPAPVPPPGGKPTTMRTGPVGQAWA
jgi:hypothetical protein